MKPRWISLASGLAVGALCVALAAIPGVRGLEEQFGLQWLFDLRGPLPPPPHAALVLMNERSADSITLPRDAERFHRCEDLRIGARPATHVSLPEMPSRWPRCLHAKLLERLSEAGARVVAFDVLFRERPPLPGAEGDLHAWQDETLARAAAASRVVIAEKIEERDGQERLADLSPAIGSNVLGAAPFPLLAEPGRRFDRFMAFKEEGFVTPTLPAIALQAYALEGYPFLRDFLVRNAGEDASLLPASTAELESRRALQASAILIRNLARSNATIAASLAADARETASAVREADLAQSIAALGALYAGEGTRLLNPYGPAGTIPSVGYDEVLTASTQENVARFGGRAVFVGYGETTRPEQVEHFATVYSRGEGADLSGVEIAATAFSNLLSDSTLRALPDRGGFAIVFVAGFVAFVLGRLLDGRVAIAVVLALAGGYFAFASWRFSSDAQWLPVILPLGVAAPLGLLAALAWKYASAHRGRARLRDAFSHFVPKDVVAKLEQNAAVLGGSQESLDCACVATDAAQFTNLAESMPPDQLAEFLNRYYETLFGRVAERGGFVSDVVGDAMLALWPDRGGDTRRRVLHALLEMRDAAERFNHEVAGDRLQTRFGVDWGRVALTTVGAHGHFEYRAVGDVVNTANRIQSLNKRLGTRILVSDPLVASGGGEFLLRNLGRYLLRGKNNPIQVHELVGLKATATATEAERCARTSEAVEFLGRGDAQSATLLLSQLRAAWPDDGPVAFLAESLAAGLPREGGAWVVE